MNEEILAVLVQIKWILGITCFYLIFRDIIRDRGRSRGNKP